MLGRIKLLFPPTRQLSFLAQSLKNSYFQMPSLPQPTRSTMSKALTQELVPISLNKTSLLNFRQLLPPSRRPNEELLKIPSRSPYWSIEVPKYISFGKKEKPKNKRVPKLILIQNPFTWLMAKIDFKVLRSIWDPNFVEEDFKLGTKQVWTFLFVLCFLQNNIQNIWLLSN